MVFVALLREFLWRKKRIYHVPTRNREWSVLDDCDKFHVFLSFFLAGSPNLGRVIPKEKPIRKLSEDDVVTQKNSVQYKIQYKYSFSTILEYVYQRIDTNNLSSQVDLDQNHTDKLKRKYNTKGLTKTRKMNNRHSHGNKKKSISYQASRASIDAAGICQFLAFVMFHPPLPQPSQCPVHANPKLI